MKKLLIIILHILGYPALLAAVLYFNWDIIMSQTKNYGIFVFVGVIVTFVMALIYYLCYIGITKKKKRKTKSIFNQTVRLCMVVVITTTGLWAVVDFALPDFLATATSSTIYYEELADGWDDRADVNEDLLNTFIELSVKAGTLPYNSDSMTEEQAIAYYQKKGLKESVKELKGNEYYDSINGLLAIQYQSINANGYQSFTHPWIDCATSDRLTIPCLVHLLLDKREIKQDAITNTKYTETKETEDGKVEVTSVFFAVYDKEKKEIVLKEVNWTVLDMLGTDTVVELGGMLEGSGFEDKIYDPFLDTLNVFTVVNNDILPPITRALAQEDLVGKETEINVIIEKNNEKKELNVILRPSNQNRGVLGYQEMAWLDSNGLIYAIVTLFSTRKLFLIFGVWGVVINLLIGLARGMGKEERARRNKLCNQVLRAQTKRTIAPPMRQR